MTSLARDVRVALRQLARDRAFSIVVVPTLGVCIGANVATFSVLNSVVLSQLPHRNAEQLVTIYTNYPGAGVERSSSSAIVALQAG